MVSVLHVRLINVAGDVGRMEAGGQGFFGLDEFDVEFLEVVEADGGVVVAGVVPRLGAEVLLEVGRLEAVAVAGEDFVAHEAEVLAGDVLEVGAVEHLLGQQAFVGLVGHVLLGLLAVIEAVGGLAIDVEGFAFLVVEDEVGLAVDLLDLDGVAEVEVEVDGFVGLDAGLIGVFVGFRADALEGDFLFVVAGEVVNYVVAHFDDGEEVCAVEEFIAVQEVLCLQAGEAEEGEGGGEEFFLVHCSIRFIC